MFSPSFNFCGERVHVLCSTFENKVSKDWDLKSSFISSGSDSGMTFLMTARTSFALSFPEAIFTMRDLLIGNFESVFKSSVLASLSRNVLR